MFKTSMVEQLKCYSDCVAYEDPLKHSRHEACPYSAEENGGGGGESETMVLQ